MVEREKVSGVDGLARTVREPSKPSELTPEEAARRVERNRAVRLRFQAMEQERAERLKGEPVRHVVRGEIGPTEATKARLRPDVLRRLHHNGRIDIDQLLAAIEIREVYEAVVRDLLPRAGRFAPGGSGRTAFVPAIERMPARLARRYELAYLPWVARFADRRWHRGGKRIALARAPLEVMIDVVVENRTIDEVVSGLGVPRACGREMVLDLLADALTAYATLSIRAREAREKELDAAARVSA